MSKREFPDMPVEAFQRLASKVEWEGGLLEYVGIYGGDLTPEFAEEVKAFQLAADCLESKWDRFIEQFEEEFGDDLI